MYAKKVVYVKPPRYLKVSTKQEPTTIDTNTQVDDRKYVGEAWMPGSLGNVCSGLFCDPKEAQDSPKTAQESPREPETAPREPEEVPEDANERPRGSS